MGTIILLYVYALPGLLSTSPRLALVFLIYIFGFLVFLSLVSFREEGRYVYSPLTILLPLIIASAVNLLLAGYKMWTNLEGLIKTNEFVITIFILFELILIAVSFVSDLSSDFMVFLPLFMLIGWLFKMFIEELTTQGNDN